MTQGSWPACREKERKGEREREKERKGESEKEKERKGEREREKDRKGEREKKRKRERKRGGWSRFTVGFFPEQLWFFVKTL